MTTSTRIERPSITRPSTSSRPRADRRGWLGGGLLSIGLVVAISWGVATYLGMLDQISAFERLQIPGSEVVALEEGTQVLSVEADRLAPAPHVRFDVVAPDGRSVPVQTYEGDLRYDVPDEPGRVGRAVATFDAATTGRYSIDVVGPHPDGALVAIGEDAARTALPSLLGALGLLTISTVGGLFILVRGTVRRRGGKR